MVPGSPFFFLRFLAMYCLFALVPLSEIEMAGGGNKPTKGTSNTQNRTNEPTMSHSLGSCDTYLDGDDCFEHEAFGVYLKELFQFVALLAVQTARCYRTATAPTRLPLAPLCSGDLGTASAVIPGTALWSCTTRSTGSLSRSISRFSCWDSGLLEYEVENAGARCYNDEEDNNQTNCPAHALATTASFSALLGLPWLSRWVTLFRPEGPSGD
nr:hypothetical protein Iba_scaffold569CG0170 [Ipomoea batatas]